MLRVVFDMYRMRIAHEFISKIYQILVWGMFWHIWITKDRYQMRENFFK